MNEATGTIYTPKVLTGRCRTATDSAGTVAHAVAGVSWWETALCGAKPGKRSNGWSEYRPSAVTCPKCLAKLAKQVHP